MDDVRLSTNNPLRPVDWRFQLASGLVCTGRFPSRHRYDGATCLLASYLGSRPRGGPMPGHHRTAARFRDLHAAYDLHGGAHVQFCAAIEAALLTADDFAALAPKLGVAVECLRSYEALFFDVRDRLAATQFIVQEVIEVYRRGHADDWPQYGWKLAAYLGGSRVLDEILGAAPIDGLQSYSARLQQQTQAVVCERLHRIVHRSSLERPAILAKLLQFATSVRSSGERVPGELEKGVQAVLEAFKLCVGPNPDPDSPLHAYDDSSIELHSDEMLRVSMGQTLPDAARLKALVYPESPPGITDK